ncbi:MAG: Spy/CpxP family protein refolding chaperone [Bryobacterales bacterium]|nr:Spy/CpxP family protein refolding chaperone [Bryobacterales bacterium]MBV9399721.1 Spy/CpxP family protein refolding chaperone [Bryobacterales bacterium]
MKIPLAVMTALMAGTLVAQAPNPSGTGQTGGADQSGSAPARSQSRSTAAQSRSERRANWVVQELTRELNLTPDQQSQIRGIFADAHKNQQALEPKIRQEHLALKSAVKSGNDAEIDRILESNSQLNTQLLSMHVKAMAKAYKVFTPEQQTKFDQMDRNWFGLRGHAAGSEKPSGGE